MRRSIAITIILSVAGFSSFARADDNGGWFCAQTSSQRQGDVYFICGMGTGMGEGAARLEALKNAVEQFDILCRNSSDCKGRPRTISPERTECYNKAFGKTSFTECTRMITVTLLNAQ